MYSKCVVYLGDPGWSSHNTVARRQGRGLARLDAEDRFLPRYLHSARALPAPPAPRGSAGPQVGEGVGVPGNAAGWVASRQAKHAAPAHNGWGSPGGLARGCVVDMGLGRGL